MSQYLGDAVTFFPRILYTGESIATSVYYKVMGFIDGSVLVKIFPSLAVPHNVAFLIFLTITLALMSLFLVFRHVKNEVVQKTKLIHASPRFRKRDKLRYYAFRFGRRFSAITEKLNKIKSQEDRRLIIIAFVKRILNIPDELSSTTLDRYRLPESFFEPDEEEDSTFPDDLKLMISSIRVFGHLEKSFFIEFCKFIETVHLDTNEYLFRIGDPDEYLYVINSGKIQVYITESDGSHSIISEVTKGGSIDSFFSVLNVLTNNPSKYTMMEAVALEPSVVLKLPTRSFLEICKPQTPALLRILQMITVRLQRLTFVAVQHHLGLSSELLRPDSSTRSFKSLQVMEELKANETANRALAGEPDDVYASPTFDPESRTLDENCNPKGLSPIIGEFQHEFDSDVNLPPRHAICSGLEFGEAPSTALKEKTQMITPSRPSTPTKELDLQLTARTSHESSTTTQSIQTSKEEEVPLTGFTRRRLNLDKESEDRLLEAVQDDFAQLLGLPNPQLLNDHLTLVSVPSGTVLSEESDMQTEVYFVVSGELHCVQSIHNFGSTEFSTLLVCHAGEVVGLLGLVTGEPNVYSLKAATKTIVAILSRESFFGLVRLYPEALYSAIRLLSSRISPLLHQLDFAIQWIAIDAGKALYKSGDPANHVYVVLSGRLRQVDSQSDGARRIAGELGRGDLVGFLEVVCSQSRVHTVLAIRDSEVAQIPALLLHHLKQRVPQVLTKIIQLLSDRLLGNLTSPNTVTSSLGLSAFGATKAARGISPEVFSAHIGMEGAANIIPKTTMSNLRTIAILPATGAINAEAFTLELQHSMTPIGSSVRLTSHIIKKRLGAHALDSINQYRLNAWLSLQEDLHRIVFFVCNCSRSSAWNRLCIRQADCVLVLALGNADSFTPSPVEMTLKNHPTKVAKALVLMYPLDTDYPMRRQTAKWLNARPWISHHYHIRCEPRVFTPRSSEDLISFYSNVFAREKPNPLSDFSRLARYLTDEAIGLVLGGGGARGCAHAGVIRAFLDAGVPIDLIGGTSMGAFMSALWAEETRFAQFTQRARKFTDSLNSIWNKLKDFTYPAVSIFSGKEFNVQLEKVFGERQVEDLWIPSFYVTTDITNCKMRVHTQGSLWRYVRASMSLSGYLPPLCDPYDGSLLLDGGYTNNVPADIMSAFGAKTIFAVDVGATVDTDFTNYGDYLSGWSLLYNRLFRSSSFPLRVPNLTEIQSRLAYISCVRQLERVKESGICHYMRPPIDHYMTLQFSAFDEILTVGYDYTKGLLRSWHEEDKLRHLVPGLRPGSLFDEPNPMAHVVTAQPHSVDGTVTPSALLTQNFDGQRCYIDLAETVTSFNTGHKSQVHTSDTEDDYSTYSGAADLGSQKRSSSLGSDLLSSFSSKHWHKRAGVRSLSEAVYSYFNSASRMVSRNLPDGVFFRRRALSASYNVSATESNSRSDSSDEAGGHFSDALDQPVSDLHRPTLASFVHLNIDNIHANQSNVTNPESASRIPERSPKMADIVRLSPQRSLPHAVHEDDDGYVEDNESDADHPGFAPGTESDPELRHEALHDIDHSGAIMRRFRSSSLNRPPVDKHFVESAENTKKVENQRFPTNQNPRVSRTRKRRRRGSLDRLRPKKLVSQLDSGVV